MIRTFRDLEIYRESYELMLKVHDSVKKLPISCPANIAEGWGKRMFEKEFKKYLLSAIGSANEMEMHLETARDLNYLPKETCQELIDKYTKLGGKIVNLQTSIIYLPPST